MSDKSKAYAAVAIVAAILIAGLWTRDERVFFTGMIVALAASFMLVISGEDSNG